MYCGPWRGGERWWRPRYELLSVGHLHVRHSGNDANNSWILYIVLKTDRQRFSFSRTNCGKIWRVVSWPLLAQMERVRWLLEWFSVRMIDNDVWLQGYDEWGRHVRRRRGDGGRSGKVCEVFQVNISSQQLVLCFIHFLWVKMRYLSVKISCWVQASS